MALKLTFTLLMLFTALPVAAQETESKQSFIDALFLDPTLAEQMKPRHQPMLLEGGFPRKDIDSTIDVQTYELWMDWVDALKIARSERGPRKAEARIKMRVRIAGFVADPIESITLDAVLLAIDSVLVGGQPTTFKALTSTLKIDLPFSLSAADTVSIDIYYALQSDTRGFNAYSPVEADTLGLAAPIAFTFSQPEDARRWFPCNDKPHDKAVFTTHTRVPVGFTAVSNGMRTDSTADTDSTAWHTWHEPSSMPTYLLAVSASRYHRYDQSVSLQGDRTIPIFNFHWLVDHEGTTLNALNALANIPAMFEPFEKAYGPYPFGSYGHMTVSPIPFGGMEHQTMSTINRGWLRGTAESGYAHELAHQWLGDLVTCATWGDIWLNEGGASFSEALWYEHKLGPEYYTYHLLGRRDRYLRRGLDEPPVYDIPIGIIFNEATTYAKSAWVYHMMRRLVGDEAFFSAMHEYVRQYSGGAAQTVDLMNLMQAQVPEPLVEWETYFDQWLYKAGHPIYASVARVNSLPEAGTYRTWVTIRQVQTGENIPQAFVMPVKIRLSNAVETMDTTVMVSQRVTDVQLLVPFQADSLEIDPEYSILCEKTQNVVTSVADAGKSPMQFQITSAVPVQRGSAVQVLVEPGSRVRVVTLDGRTLGTSTESASLLILDSSQWPLGVVAIVVENGSSVSTQTLPVID